MKLRGIPFLYPTTSLAGLLFVLSAMWYAASSQNNAAAYLLLFALVSVWLVSIPHTFLNRLLPGRKFRCRSRSRMNLGRRVRRSR